jgi:hypothetical protein
MLRKQLNVIGSWTFFAAVQAECARFVVDREIAMVQPLSETMPRITTLLPDRLSHDWVVQRRR